ncbi:hypothetical protein PQX77_014339 [Marasmius sp. AFHP31]|nr:hypothetical protein PQX77_014339 [Marasmius sp. AFHP31]
MVPNVFLLLLLVTGCVQAKPLDESGSEASSEPKDAIARDPVDDAKDKAVPPNTQLIAARDVATQTKNARHVQMDNWVAALSHLPSALPVAAVPLVRSAVAMTLAAVADPGFTAVGKKNVVPEAQAPSIDIIHQRGANKPPL